jgi:hypothetical protein
MYPATFGMLGFRLHSRLREGVADQNNFLKLLAEFKEDEEALVFSRPET